MYDRCFEKFSLHRFSEMSFERNLEVAQGLASAIKNEIKKLDSATGSERTRIDSKIDGMISDLQSKIGSLRGQLNSLSPDQKSSYSEDIKDLDKDRADMQTELRRKRQVYSQNSQVQNAHDQNMATGGKILNSLDQTIAINNDTLKTQENTMNTLAEDQKHFDNISSNLSIVDTEAETGEATAKRMVRRQMIQRGVAWGLVAVLIIILIVSMWYKMRPQ